MYGNEANPMGEHLERPVSRRRLVARLASGSIGAGALVAVDGRRAEAFRASPNRQGQPVLKVIDVTDYGASGSGAVDDSAAINRAITQAPAGATAYFPVGAYRIDHTIAVRNSIVRLLGSTAVGGTAGSTILANFGSGDLVDVSSSS